MESALNKRTGSLESAWQARRTDNFICPECKAPVTLRKGNIKDHCFAHKHKVADSTCPLFHPGAEGSTGLLSTSQPSKNLTVTLPPNLQLTGSVREGFKLEIYLPPARQDVPWTGTIFFQGYLGEYRFYHKFLEKVRTFRVLPSQVRYLFTRMGKVDDQYWSYYAEGITGLEQVTCFHPLGDTGRRLAKNDSMRWGQSFHLLISKGIEPPPRDSKHWLSQEGILDDLWEVWNLELPVDPPSHWVIENFQKWLGRKIEIPSPAILLQSPLPYRLEVDGTLLLAAPVTYLELESTTHRPHIQDGEGKIISPLQVSTGRYTCSLNGADQIQIRLKDCLEWRLSVITQDPDFHLAPEWVIEPDLPLSFLEGLELLREIRDGNLSKAYLVLRFPPELQGVISLNGETLISETNLASAVHDRKQPFHLQAGAFGSVWFLPEPAPEPQVDMLAACRIINI